MSVRSHTVTYFFRQYKAKKDINPVLLSSLYLYITKVQERKCLSDVYLYQCTLITSPNIDCRGHVSYSQTKLLGTSH